MTPLVYICMCSYLIRIFDLAKILIVQLPLTCLFYEEIHDSNLSLSQLSNHKKREKKFNYTFKYYWMEESLDIVGIILLID